jgi:hypothetical protein
VGTYNVPPATGINYSSWALVNIIFNHWIKNKVGLLPIQFRSAFSDCTFTQFFAWWAKYNYILAAALDFGTAFAGIIIFFAVSYPGFSFPDWWGNNVYLNTADGKGLAWKEMPAVGYFGPANGTWT